MSVSLIQQNVQEEAMKSYLTIEVATNFTDPPLVILDLVLIHRQ